MGFSALPSISHSHKSFSLAVVDSIISLAELIGSSPHSIGGKADSIMVK